MQNDKIKLSKHGSSFVQRKLNSKRKAAEKSHGYDARNFHQNANRHGIHALTTFDCPICQCKNTVKVELNTTSHIAVVKCSYCTSLTPRPIDLPYPFSTPYVPKLENRADAFFRFSESYRKLLATAQNNNSNNNNNNNASKEYERTYQEYEPTKSSHSSRRGLLNDVREIIEQEERIAGNDHTNNSAQEENDNYSNYNNEEIAESSINVIKANDESNDTKIDNSVEFKNTSSDKDDGNDESNEVDDVFAFFNDDN